MSILGMLSEGDPAPTITAQNQRDESITPDFSEPTVVYFYPRDGTPGCTIEAQQFQEHLPAFEAMGVPVYGVSTDSVEKHAEFAAEEGLEFELLADPDGTVADGFDLDVQDNYIQRITFALDEGEVAAVVDADDVTPEGHAEEVRSVVDELTA